MLGSCNINCISNLTPIGWAIRYFENYLYKAVKFRKKYSHVQSCISRFCINRFKFYLFPIENGVCQNKNSVNNL